jgi:hypothetical protein
MAFFAAAQLPAPQAGWALQYTLDLQPAAARSYEPKALMTQTTARNIERLLEFYRMTGEPHLIARIPEALDWLESCRLPAGVGPAGYSHPTFIEVGTGSPLFLHRTGSNARNGHYHVDHDPQNTVAHYSSFRNIDLSGLRSAYATALKLSASEIAAASPLRPQEVGQPLPRYFVVDDEGAEGGGTRRGGRVVDQARRAVKTLNGDGWWPAPLNSTSHPYRADAEENEKPGDYARTLVGDASDTSPYRDDARTIGISTSAYIRNMRALILHLQTAR